jgi:hypothetical protein
VGTATGIRFSTVNGYAFADNCPADVLAAAGTGAKIKVYDASSRYLEGLIDSVGTSETLSEKVTNGDNESAVMSGVTAVRGAIAQSNEQANGGTYSAKFTGNDTGRQYINATSAETSLALYKLSCDIYVPTGTSYSSAFYFMAIPIAELFGLFSNTKDSWLSSSAYRTQIAGQSGISVTSPIGISGDYYYVDNFSVSQVTSPSSSGVVIKDLSGNQNWISKNSLFTYNAASYTYEIVYPSTKRRTGLLLGVY